jgi:hypothetical protein
VRRDGITPGAPSVGCLLLEGSHFLFICSSTHESYSLRISDACKEQNPL